MSINLKNINTTIKSDIKNILDNFDNIYFIGIGGIGMSAIAKYFLFNGKNIVGYDKTITPITKSLEANGIKICYEDKLDLIPSSFLNNKKTIIIYTPAITNNNQQLNYFSQQDFLILKRSEILGKITEKTFCFGVAGTHGKTTTASILGHIMSLENATSFIGGISNNYNSNLIYKGNKISVVEADEFDRSFLHLSPNIACITSIDADHLDVYKKHKNLLDSFNDFAKKVSDYLIVAKGIPLKGLTYAIEEDADYVAENLTIKNGIYFFDVITPKTKIQEIEFHLPGKHNVMNAMAAIAMADVYGVSLDKIKKQLASYKGVKRRFSYRIKSKELVLIDDYAHHPTELEAVYNSVREMYPKDKLLAIFQPHLYSRTRDFSDKFAKVLSKFDELLLLNIYPARELPIEGITSEWLLSKIKLESKSLTIKQKIVNDIKKSGSRIILMLGAGDIGLLVNKVVLELEKKIKNEK